MAAIDFGTGADTATGDNVAQALAKLQARIDALTSTALTTLTLSKTTATVGTSFSATVLGQTSGSSLALSGAGAAGLSLIGATVSGTPTTAGPINLIETLGAAKNSPLTSSAVATVSAASGFVMSKFAAALNATKANTADTYWGSEGDSTHMGRGQGTGGVGTDGARTLTITANYAARLKTLINLPVRTDAFFGSGLVGSIAEYAAYNTQVTIGTDWVISGTSTAGGMIFAKSSANAGAFNHTSTEPWDEVDIFTPQDTGYTGTLVCKIDGGSATNIAAAGTKMVKKTTIKAGSLANHTLSMDSLDANQVQLLGCIFRNTVTKSVIVINMGARGWTASSWASTSAPWSPANMAAFLGLHGVDYSLGINDFRDGSTLTQAAFLSSVTANLSLLNSKADVVMMAPTDISSGSNTGTLTMAGVGAVYKQYASDNGYGFLDTIAAVGDYATVNGAGNMYDNLHFKAPVAAAGGVALANSVYAALQRAGFTPASAGALGLTGSPAAATNGTAYTFTPSTSGGTSPYTFSLPAGSLPAGLTLNTSTGAISGTPSGSGASSFTLRVTDAAGATANLATSITVAVATLALAGTPAAATQNASYAFTPARTGGLAPFSYSISAGALPAGLTLNTSTGAVTGTPTAAGTSNFTIRVADSQGTPAVATLATSITVSAVAANAFSETFGATDGSSLAAHTSDSGHTWSLLATPWTITNGRAIGGNANAQIAALSSYSMANGYVEVDFYFASAINQGIFAVVRAKDASNGILFGYRASVGGWTVINFSAANFVTQLGGVASFTPTAGTTKRARLEFSGQNYVLKIDGVTVVTATDTSSALMTTGFLGLGDFTGASTATTGAHFDNMIANPS